MGTLLSILYYIVQPDKRIDTEIQQLYDKEAYASHHLQIYQLYTYCCAKFMGDVNWYDESHLVVAQLHHMYRVVIQPSVSIV